MALVSGSITLVLFHHTIHTIPYLVHYSVAYAPYSNPYLASHLYDLTHTVSADSLSTEQAEDLLKEALSTFLRRVFKVGLFNNSAQLIHEWKLKTTFSAEETNKEFHLHPLALLFTYSTLYPLPS